MRTRLLSFPEPTGTFANRSADHRTVVQLSHIAAAITTMGSSAGLKNMIPRQAKSDQKHTVAKRPRIAAVRIGEKSTARPSTMSDYAHELQLVRINATGPRCAVLKLRLTKVTGWSRANLLAF